MNVLYVFVAIWLTTAAVVFGHWLSCRLNACPCPKCGSKWRTELVGEWGDEMWHCHACGHGWTVPYARLGV